MIRFRRSRCLDRRRHSLLRLRHRLLRRLGPRRLHRSPPHLGIIVFVVVDEND